MENNKSYLRNIPVVFLVAACCSFLYLGSELLLPKDGSSQTIINILQGNVPGIFFYVALGLLTSRWRETLIAAGAYILLSTGHHLLQDEKDFGMRLLFYFLHPLPLLLFFGFQFGWQKKLWAAYFVVFVVVIMFNAGFWASQGLRYSFYRIWEYSDIVHHSIGVLFRIASFVCAVIFVGEIMNSLQGKSDPWNTKLINLGNDYGKMNGFIVFWSLKVMVWVLIIRTGDSITSYSFYLNRDNFPEEAMGIIRFLLFTGIINLVAFIVGGLALAWYMRKFLLEYFFTYNTRSKFLYWFSLLPVIGFLSFLIAHFDNRKQLMHSEKRTTMEHFAVASTTSVTAIFFTLLTLRGIFQLSSGQTTLIISIIINMLLFIWMMADRTGFYVNLILNLALLAIGIIVVYTAGRSELPLSLLFALSLLNMMHLVLLYPVYHFDDFEYTPPEDPDAPTTKEFHLFDTP